MTRIEAWGVEGIGEVQAGDALDALIAGTGAELRDGDIVVVTSKVVEVRVIKNGTP